MIYSRITGTGSLPPEAPIGNAEPDRSCGLDSSDEWIVERTGIRSRHLSAQALLAAIRRRRPVVARLSRRSGAGGG